jgi:hypothetical protein
MKDKKVSLCLSVLEILIQGITFFSAGVAIFFCAMEKPDSEIWKIMLIWIPVIAAYFFRKYIHRFSIFIGAHVLLLIAAVLTGETDTEQFFLFLLCGIIVIYSVRLKMLTVQKNDISNIPVTDSAQKDLTERIQQKTFLAASEQVHMAFVSFMVIGYMAGAISGRKIVMNLEVVLFIAFILLQVLYNDLKKLNMVFATNSHKKEFPAQQLKRVNVLIIVSTCILILVGMLLFYNGEYGNIFSIIGTGVFAAFRWIIRLILAIWGSGKAGSSSVQEEATEAAEEILDEADFYEPSVAAQAAMEVVGIALVIAAVAGVIYMIYVYAKGFNNAKRKDTDYLEKIKPAEKAKRTASVKMQKKEAKPSTESEAVRKFYKKSVIRGSKKKKPDNTLQPSELTRAAITDNRQDSEEITKIYEKARYSNEQITKEETKHLKEIVKRGLTD